MIKEHEAKTEHLSTSITTKVFVTFIALGMVGMGAYNLGEALGSIRLAYGGLIVTWMCGAASMIGFLSMIFEETSISDEAGEQCDEKIRNEIERK